MKSVLISIKPQYCELIASGKKTVEVRKTRPKLETPFKVYIYETQGRTETPFIDEEGHHIFKGRGQVIGEFVCEQIGTTSWVLSPDHRLWKEVYNEECCLTNRELYEYSKGGIFYEWHISNLVIYDKPRELSGFYVEGDCDCMNCKKCAWFDKGNGYNVEGDCNLAYKCIELHKSFKPIKRPPQSWCYVESEGEG